MSEQQIRREIAEAAAGLLVRYVAIIFVAQALPAVAWMAVAIWHAKNNDLALAVVDAILGVICFWMTAKSLRQAFMKVARIAGYY